MVSGTSAQRDRHRGQRRSAHLCGPGFAQLQGKHTLPRMHVYPKIKVPQFREIYFICLLAFYIKSSVKVALNVLCVVLLWTFSTSTLKYLEKKNKKKIGIPSSRLFRDSNTGYKLNYPTPRLQPRPTTQGPSMSFFYILRVSKAKFK